MLVDIFRDPGLDKILILEDGKGLSRISDAGSGFLSNLEFKRQIDTEHSELPNGLDKDVVLASLKEHGYFAARLKTVVSELKIVD